MLWRGFGGPNQLVVQEAGYTGNASRDETYHREAVGVSGKRRRARGLLQRTGYETSIRIKFPETTCFAAALDIEASRPAAVSSVSDFVMDLNSQFPGGFGWLK